MATRYPNGRVPRSELVQFDTGNGRHLGTLKMMVMWYALRAYVYRTHGVWLAISSGMNVYRDWDEQGVGRRNACAQGNCLAAAAQGWSSHGMTWRHSRYTGGQWVDTGALDVGNWYLIGKDAWFAACRKFGFEPGLIDKSVAGTDEWWHIIVFRPYDPAPQLSGTVTNEIHRTAPKGSDNMSIQIRNNQQSSGQFGLIAQVGPDYFAAMPNVSSADVVRNVFSDQDERHELSEIEFYAVTDSCGIPRDKVAPGSYWSRELDNQHALTAIKAKLGI